MESFDDIYNYEVKRVRIEDPFLLPYCIFTITNRPRALHLDTYFRIEVEGNTLIFRRAESKRIYDMFEKYVLKYPDVLDEIEMERRGYEKLVEEAIERGNKEEIKTSLFMLGRYGLEWYFPYDVLKNRLRNYFSEGEILEISYTLRKPSIPTYYDLIAIGLNRLSLGKIKMKDFIEDYAWLDRRGSIPSRFEDPRYVNAIVKNFSDPNLEEETWKIVEENKKEREDMLRRLERTDWLTYKLSKGYSRLSDENERIHYFRAKALKHLFSKNI